MWRIAILMTYGAFGLVGISACTYAPSHDTYPDYYPQIKTKSGKCADISGKYEASNVLLAEAFEVYGDISAIEIHSDANILRLIAFSDDDQIRKTLSRENGDFQCLDDGIILLDMDVPLKQERGTGVYKIGSRKRMVVVYPATDGSLIMWYGEIGSGAAAVYRLPPIPFSDETGYWYRFEPVD